MSRGGNRGETIGQESESETVGTKPTRLQKLCFEAIQSMPRRGVRVPGHAQAVVLQISAYGSLGPWVLDSDSTITYCGDSNVLRPGIVCQCAELKRQFPCMAQFCRPPFMTLPTGMFESLYIYW